MAKTISAAEISDVLVFYIQSGSLNFIIGSGASVPAIDLAGGIETEIDELLVAGDNQSASLKALEFIQSLESQNLQLSLGTEGGVVAQTLVRYSEFLHTLDQLLFKRKSNLLPRQANIYTTNYDTFFEEAAGRSASLALNDGFDRTSSLTGAYKFSPERYFDRIYRSGAVYTRQAEVPTINLVKLHGSLTWRQTNSGIRFRSQTPQSLDLTTEHEADAIQTALRQRALILPTMRKHGSTMMDRTYYDLLRIFANSLENENAILLAFGFSFADEHLREVTLRSLRNPTSQMIVFAYDAAAVEKFEALFEGQRNIIIVAPQNEETIDFANFSGLLNQVIAPQASGNE